MIKKKGWIIILILIVIPLTAGQFGFDNKNSEYGFDRQIFEGNNITNIYEILNITGNLTNFTMLLDTPNSYVSFAGKCVVVKNDETGLEFVDCSGGVSEALVDTQPPYLYDNTTRVFFNETQLNATIDNKISNANISGGGGDGCPIYNYTSGYGCINYTKIVTADSIIMGARL